MIRLAQTASLQQKMAPQLIQSLRLLQMPTLELQKLIQQELEINPLLELNEEEETQDEETEEQETVEDTAESEEVEASGEEEASAEEDAPDEELDFDEADLDKEQFDEEDWNEFLNESGYVSTKEEFDPNVEEWDNHGASQASLEDTLKEQLLLSELNEADQQIGEFVIGNIDEDGLYC